MVKGERPQTRHLIPAKKGEIRNPDGMPIGTITKHKLLIAIEKAVSGKIAIKDQFTGKRTKREVVDMLAAQLIADSLSKDNNANERTNANKAIQERLLGKPVDSLALMNPDGTPLTPQLPPTIIINFMDGTDEPK